MPEKLIILDRDGVINQDSDAYIKSVDEWLPIPGSLEAIARLKSAGYSIAIATNQSGLARGYFNSATLAEMHTKMANLLAALGSEIDGIFYCPHGPDDNCDCRKPLPGLVHQIEKALGLSAKGCYFVGDSLRDLQAAKAAGCKPVLVKSGKGLATYKKIKTDKSLGFERSPIFENLEDFANSILTS